MPKRRASRYLNQSLYRPSSCSSSQTSKSLARWRWYQIIKPSLIRPRFIQQLPQSPLLQVYLTTNQLILTQANGEHTSTQLLYSVKSSTQPPLLPSPFRNLELTGSVRAGAHLFAYQSLKQLSYFCFRGVHSEAKLSAMMISVGW